MLIDTGWAFFPGLPTPNISNPGCHLLLAWYASLGSPDSDRCSDLPCSRWAWQFWGILSRSSYSASYWGFIWSFPHDSRLWVWGGRLPSLYTTLSTSSSTAVWRFLTLLGSVCQISPRCTLCAVLIGHQQFLIQHTIMKWEFLRKAPFAECITYINCLCLFCMGGFNNNLSGLISDLSINVYVSLSLWVFSLYFGLQSNPALFILSLFWPSELCQLPPVSPFIDPWLRCVCVCVLSACSSSPSAR